MNKSRKKFGKGTRVAIFFCSLLILLGAVTGLTHVISVNHDGNDQSKAVSDSPSENSSTKGAIDSEVTDSKTNNEAAKTDKGSDTDPGKELLLVDYDDIVRLNEYLDRDNKKATEKKQTIENNNSDSKKKQSSSSNGSSSSSKKTVTIDESSETMKDETKQNEYQGEKSQEPIDFSEVKPSGKMPNGDVPAGGKQNVGKWN